ncbi:hypothetical protein Ga0609869_001405 [Rhodovulum iodosum]|uniref:Sulfotransferase family protein n=1 Tax=Rhodovulum iodosum TaxID=68291 RepID=A0ABV3XUG8_9RHOB|nr:hypothetical protein [Rhodovulum robiginosum]RSK30395.1 hypothetical protein EJA01_16540 [Rhodovulum robiginosum]
MARLILHVGTHKTATTTLQETFDRNRSLLQRHGVVYPDLGRRAGHHGLVTHWFDLPEVYALGRPAASVWRDLSDRYAKTDATVFISSEEFSRGNRTRRVDFAELREMVSAFDSVEVLCLLREQTAFLQSIFLEISKNPRQVGWREFYDKAMKSRFASGLFLDYNQLYDHILAGFAPEEITFLAYDAARASEGGVIGEVLRRTGAPLTPGDMDQGQSANVSPDPLTFWAARMVAAGRRITPELLESVGRAVHREFGDNCRTTIFNASELRAVGKHFEAANRRFVERVAQQQPDFDLPPSSLAENVINRSQLGAGFWMRVARIVYSAQDKLPAEQPRA